MSEDKNQRKWQHPGGKLRELGADKLSDTELLAILISTGTKNKSAEDIANELFEKFGSYKGLVNQPLKDFLCIKGLGDVKIIRLAATFEMARRISKQIIQEYEKN